jgi:1,4-alpha-glucan branching enzyme
MAKETTLIENNIGGMGSIVQPKGVFFRVWAPNADQVFVTGGFNNWNNSANCLQKEDNGYWAGLVEKAKAGDEYKYFLETPYGDLMRNDPYARAVTSSVAIQYAYLEQNGDLRIAHRYV